MGKKINAQVGNKYERWTVTGEGHKAGYWMCQCSCGISKSVRFDTLMNGTSTNCGCLKLEKWIERNTKYRNGEVSDKRFYRIWQGMNDRCNEPKYINYHGRGIVVCKRWNSKNRDGYLNFYRDMYNSYLDHLKKSFKYWSLYLIFSIYFLTFFQKFLYNFLEFTQNETPCQFII